ncbi:MAG: TonB-dependent receptor [Chitinophagales bacterium]|jgi:outer membrane receptor protein involved in Fe transport|nr:TonB-dependent receptor [Chitinophagales bacterium]
MFRLIQFSFFIFILQITNPIFAQNVTISGYVTDKSNSENIKGAMIQITSLTGVGVYSNSYGFYSLTIPKGNHTVTVKYLGFETIEQSITVEENKTINFALPKKNRQIAQVVIKSKKNKQDISSTQMGKVDLDMKEVEKIPVILGEKDVLKTIQLLPGIMTAQEGNSNFVVRGGNTDQNLIQLDEATVYNATHLLGFFSTFNSDAVKDVSVYKGNMPAEYGGRLSSIVDIKMKEGSKKYLSFGGGIGLIASRLYVESPLFNQKASFLVAGRRTYVDAFTALSSDSNVKRSALYFYDFNGKFNYNFDDKNKLYVSGYFGRDRLGLNGLFIVDYGNTTLTTRYNRIINDKLFSNTSLIYNNFNYDVTLNFQNIDFDLYVRSILTDFSLKQDFDYFLNDKNSLKFGFLGTYHNVLPGEVSSSNPIIASNTLSKSNGLELAAYIQNDHKISEKLNLNYGLRLSFYGLIGNNTNYNYDEFGRVIDTLKLSGLNMSNVVLNPEPRVTATYKLNEETSLKASYARNAQYIHLLSNNTSAQPTDRWVLSNNNIRPGISDQFAIGYFRNFEGFEFNVETYYKILQNQIDYKTGALLRANETIDKDLIYGDGRAYGVELFFKKNTGKLTGWVSYTLSRSERRFSEVSDGAWFLSRFDRPHYLNVVAMYELNKKWSFSATLVYYTGNAVTFPSGIYGLNGNLNSTNLNNNNYFLNYGNTRNSQRFPDYFRMDIAATLKLKETPTWYHDLNFSLYNLTGMKNPYLITFKSDEVTRENFIEKTYLFTFVPAITYNFRFKKNIVKNETE